MCPKEQDECKICVQLKLINNHLLLLFRAHKLNKTGIHLYSVNFGTFPARAWLMGVENKCNAN